MYVCTAKYFQTLALGLLMFYIASTECGIHVLMRGERRKDERGKQDQTNNKVKQHSTPKAVTFPKKNELPRVGLEPMTLYTLDRTLYHVYIYIYMIFMYYNLHMCFSVSPKGGKGGQALPPPPPSPLSLSQSQCINGACTY